MAKKILVIGANGMLGHTLLAYLNSIEEAEVYFTSRDSRINSLNHYFLELTDFESLNKIIKIINPNFVVNCAGVLVSDSETNVQTAIEINALLPHRILDSIREDQTLIHVSTDCVFDGSQGWNDTSSKPNPKDFYGMSKSLGEIKNKKNCITLRTSIIGFETSNHKTGLIEWFINTKSKKVQGYANALWNGVTTLDLSIVISEIIFSDKRYSGLIHISSRNYISKYELLKIINNQLNLAKIIVPDYTQISNKTLSPSDCILNSLFPDDYQEMLDRYFQLYKKLVRQ